VLLPTPALAQTPPGSIEVGGGAGRFFGGTLARGSTDLFAAKVDVDNDSVGGFWLAARVSQRWSVELAYRRATTRIVQYRGGLFAEQPALGGLDVASLELLAERSFPLGRFVPYLSGGAGLTNLDIDVPDEARRDSTRASLAAAGGARYYLLPWFGIRIDMRVRATYLGRRAEPFDRGWSDSGRWFKAFEGTGGVFFSFAPK
jgi:hypothetical protein